MTPTPARLRLAADAITGFADGNTDVVSELAEWALRNNPQMLCDLFVAAIDRAAALRGPTTPTRQQQRDAAMRAIARVEALQRNDDAALAALTPENFTEAAGMLAAVSRLAAEAVSPGQLARTRQAFLADAAKETQ